MKALLKIFPIVLTMMIILSVLAACVPAQPQNGTNNSSSDATQTPIKSIDETEESISTFDIEASPLINEEIRRAVTYGFVPTSIYDDLNKAITFSEFSEMLSLLVSKYKSEASNQWQDVAVNASESDEPMLREDGILELFYAANTIGLDSPTINWGETADLVGEQIWDELSWDYPLFPDWNEKQDFDNQEWDNHMIAAYFYVMGRVSATNNSLFFEMDDTSASFRANEPLMRAEAIKAVVRLFESDPDLLQQYMVLAATESEPFDLENDNDFITNGSFDNEEITDSLENIEDKDIIRAVSYGFIPVSIIDNFSETITYAEYTKMISRMISMYMPDAKEQWRKDSSLAAIFDEPMKREDGMLEIYYASIAMGLDQTNTNWGQTHDRIGEKGWEEISWNFVAFPNWEEPQILDNNEWENYMVAAYCYTMGRSSLITGKTLLEVDENKISMRTNEPFTRAEAIQSVVRLIESDGALVKNNLIGKLADNKLVNENGKDIFITQENVDEMTTVVNAISDNEILRAIRYGYVPKSSIDDLSRPITYAEYTSMLTKMISIYKPDAVDQWQTVSGLAALQDQPMLREDAMLEIYYAAMTIGLDQPNANWGDTASRIGDKIWDELSWIYPLFPDWNDKQVFDNEEWDNHMIAAFFYTVSRTSSLSSETLLSVDESSVSLRADQPFTCAEAIQSVTRLYESDLHVIERKPVEFDKVFLQSVEERKQSILESPTSVEIEGTAYFVSNNGNDENDGTSAETAWATLDKVNSAKLASGDGVFFERGGLWRGQLISQAGVTYSAYGEGVKPAIYGSMENAADPSKWHLLDGSETIWVYANELSDVGTLVFNEGENWGYKEIPSYVDGNFVLRENHDSPFIITDALEHNYEFFSEVDKVLTDGAPYRYNTPENPRNVGKLYLYLDEGNPGELFNSIEILVRKNIILPADDVIYDNLTIKYTGAHALYSWGNRITVQNCEFGWIGGSIMAYDTGTNDVTRYGNAIESDGTYDGYKVLNNYIYQVYDTAATNQDVDFGNTYSSLSENIVYSGNVFEYCTYGIEVLYATGGVEDHLTKNVLIDDNYILYSGYGWGNQRPDVDHTAAIMMWEHPNPTENFVIQNNVFYLGTQTLLWGGAELKWQPDLSGNTYIQNANGILGYWRTADGTEVKAYHISSPNIDEIVRNVFGDENAVIIPPTIN